MPNVQRGPKPKTPYFDAEALPEPQACYVVWLDVMGTRSTMSRSLPMAANFVCKLHVSALEGPHAPCTLYPMLDGLYITATSRDDLAALLECVFASNATLFLNTDKPQHRHFIKASVAFGPAVPGSDIPEACTRTLNDNPGYRASILLGIPLAQAFAGERKAPPFGVYVHESARAFAPIGQKPFPYRWWQWFGPHHRDMAQQLGIKIQEHYSWCEAQAYQLEYPVDRIREHRKMAAEYFLAQT